MIKRWLHSLNIFNPIQHILTLVRKAVLAVFVVAFGFPFAHGQTSDSLQLLVLDTIVISSTRLDVVNNELPLAVSKHISISPETSQLLSLKEQLLTIPGVYSQNAYNYAQDLRISIRGFGSRSAFGINGIKIMVDGVPETTPDGQGQLDNLNLGQIAQLEVIKSSSSAIYGNASGGVIHITTTQNFAKNFLELNTNVGSFGFGSYGLSGGLEKAKTKITGLAKYLHLNGYRQHSQLRQFNGALRVNHSFTEKAKISVFAEIMDSPLAQDPGGLTLDEANTNFTAARQANLDYDAGEAVRQMKTGMRFSYELNPASRINSYFFYNRREFNGRLPFEFGGLIDLQRNYFGHGSDFELKSGKNRLKIGYDALFQNDARQRFENLLGEQGQMTFHQEEVFNNFGIYALDHLKIGKFNLNFGGRYDYNIIKAVDLNSATGDNSSTITLNNFSPSAGLGYLFDSRLLLYTNYSYGFKTPTLNQLTNRPDGQEGFNDLKPQIANNYELGLKKTTGDWQAEAAIFYIRTKDDLVPYELAQFPGRTLFRNVGETDRRGIETSIAYIFQKLTLTGSYTYSDFRYNEVFINNEDLTGKLLPGLPRHFANLLVAYSGQRLEAELNFNYVGELFAEDQNLTTVNDYLLANLRASYNLPFKQLSIKPYLGVNNLFNMQYFDNIRINAFGQRYYEPAPQVNFYLGIKIRLTK